MKKPVLILSSLFIVITVLTVTRAAVSNQLSTSGIDLTKVSEEIARYQRENALLEEKILHVSSYITILEEAEKRGYTQAQSQLVLSDSVPIAYKP